jgi:hypothetical protein
VILVVVELAAQEKRRKRVVALVALMFNSGPPVSEVSSP